MMGVSNGLYCDARMWGAERWVYGNPDDALVRLPDAMLRCVAFVSYEDRRGKHVDEGTGFFIYVASEADPGIKFHYIVTAKHLLAPKTSRGRKLRLRLNKKNGGSEYIDAPQVEDWAFADTSDIAVTHLQMDTWAFDVATLDVAACANAENMEQVGVGVGDQLATVGMFSERPGMTRISPIVRTGTIAAMPDEPVQDQLGNKYPAYLTEARSIPGTSGAPVFLMLEYGRPIYKTPHGVEVARAGPVWLLLGVMRGHWNLIGAGRQQRYSGKEILRLNTGISLVTPIQRVTEILLSPETVADRQRATPKPNLPVCD